MEQLARSDASLLVGRIGCQLDDARQTGVEVYIDLLCVQGQSELESLLRVPADEVLFVMLLGSLVVDDRVCVATYLPEQVEHLVCYVLTVDPLVPRVPNDILEEVVLLDFVVILSALGSLLLLDG